MRIRAALPPYGQEGHYDLRIHDKKVCAPPCPYHSPSDHHMKKWEKNLRLDREDMLVERICPHGCGHPDPDSLNYIKLRGGDGDVSGIHGCDGCCRGVQ